MKLDELRDALRSRNDIAAWRVSETRRNGVESYLVRDKPDLSRSKRTLDYQVTVFVDSGSGDSRTRGSATASVHPTMGRGGVEAVLDRAIFAASKSRNPWYPLTAPAPAAISMPPSGFESRPPEAWTGELLAALYAEAGTPGRGRVNSLELFLSRVERRVLDSGGVDAAWSGWSGTVEATVEAEGSSGGVELTDWIRFAEPDFGMLRSEMGRRLTAVSDRARARPMPGLEGLPLILAGNDAEAILGWFFQNLDASRVFAKSSPFALGDSLHGPQARAGEYDPLDLRAEPVLRGSPRSAPFDGEGFPLAPLACVEKGVATAFHGPSRYAHYLGLRPAGSFSLFSVGPGSVAAAALRGEPSLEVAYFSDFDVDPDSGDFGGEIRLAYWNDGKERIPVSGGSVTGSLLENRGRIRFSRETAMSEGMLGPEAILLPKVSVTSAG